MNDNTRVDYFLSDWHVRVTWIGFMTLFVFWGLTWFVRFAFGGDSHSVPTLNIHPSGQVTADPTTIDPESNHYQNTSKQIAVPAWSVNIFNRLNRAHDFLRDLVILLLSALTINSFARASARGVMIITWIFVAFAVVYFVVEASYEHRYIRLVFSSIFYGLGLAIVGLAYKKGFY